jgi:glycosyltransferase involved in cell wall biosynthesis
MTTYQFYPSCFPTTHTFYTKCLIPQSKDIFIDINKGNSRLSTRIRQLKYLATQDIGQLFGYDSLSNKADMLYSNGPIYCGKENWVLDIMDSPLGMVGYNWDIFQKNKDAIGSILEADNCKKIIARCEDSINIMKKYFSSKVIDKISLEKVELPKKEYVKEKKPFIQVLFIGSINNPQEFYRKVSLPAIEAINRLAEHYHIKAVIRCEIPNEVFNNIKDNPNLVILKDRISDDELDKLYKQSDVLVTSSPVMPYMATLEAKSYGIPVISYDTFGIRGYITDKINGFIIKPSSKVQKFFNDEKYPYNDRDKEFIEGLNKLDDKVIRDICASIKTLMGDDYKK